MTSAARPTWSAALGSGGGLRDGSSSAPTLQTCAKDQPGHLILKLRQIGQDAPEELRSRNYKNENVSSKRITAGLISGDSDAEIDDSDSDNENKYNHVVSNNEEYASQNECSGENNEEENVEHYCEDDDDDDDEEAELMRELEKIRREREAEKAAKERKAAERNPHSVFAGNPLLATSTSNDVESSSSFGAKRRWDDDVVFKNQAKGIDEKPQKRFINDTTRSDFHRRFMDKFIK